MKITVNDQHIIIDRTEIVGNSSKLYEVQFDFDPSWEGFNKVAVFQLGYAKPVTMVLINDACVIPWEVLPQKGGMLKIGVFGTKGDIEKPTIWCHEIQVNPGTPDDGIAGKEPTQEVFDQIMQAIDAGKLKGDTGNGIEKIELISAEGFEKKYRIYFTDGGHFDYTVKDGEQGKDGRGIKSLTKTNETSLGFTLHIVLTDDSEYDYDVKNGRDGDDYVITQEDYIAIANIVKGGIDLSTYATKEELATKPNFSDLDRYAQKESLAELYNEVEAEAQKNDARWKMSQGIVWDTETVESDAYSVTVPTGGVKADIDMIGGKSVVWNQLIGDYANESVGNLTYELTGKKLKISGTATSTSAFYFTIGRNDLIQKHIYYLGYDTDIVENSAMYMQVYCNTNRQVHGVAGGGLFVLESNPYNLYARIIIESGVNVNNYIDNVYLCDMTKLFGVTEKSQVTQTMKDMTKRLYLINNSYTEGTIIHADTNEIYKRGRNLLDLSLSKKCTYSADYDRSILTETGWITTGHNLIGFKVKVEPNTSYVFTGIKKLDNSQFRCYEYSVEPNAIYTSGDGFVSLTVNSNGSVLNKSFTTKNNTEWIIISCFSNDANDEIKNIQLEQGSTATAYTPYNEQTVPMPTAITSLDGYGWSAGSVFNEVDFENKKFIKRVGRVDLGDLNWIYSASYITSGGFSCVFGDIGLNANVGMLCQNYEVMIPDTAYAAMVDKSIKSASTTNRLHVRDDSYTDSAAFKNSLKGEYLYYELKAPIETDISDILPTLDVETGGSITFKQASGYHLHFPNKETYLIALNERVNA